MYSIHVVVHNYGTLLPTIGSSSLAGIHFLLAGFLCCVSSVATRLAEKVQPGADGDQREVYGHHQRVDEDQKGALAVTFSRNRPERVYGHRQKNLQRMSLKRRTEKGV